MGGLNNGFTLYVAGYWTNLEDEDTVVVPALPAAEEEQEKKNLQIAWKILIISYKHKINDKFI